MILVRTFLTEDGSSVNWNCLVNIHHSSAGVGFILITHRAHPLPFQCSPSLPVFHHGPQQGTTAWEPICLWVPGNTSCPTIARNFIYSFIYLFILLFFFFRQTHNTPKHTPVRCRLHANCPPSLGTVCRLWTDFWVWPHHKFLVHALKIRRNAGDFGCWPWKMTIMTQVLARLPTLFG